jgi:hypothetical protein
MIPQPFLIMPDLSLDEVEVSWGELARCEHLVQMYENEAVFLDSLTGFVGEGLLLGEAVVVVATSLHLNALETRLQAAGINLIATRASDQYLPFDAAETLSRFMINAWPDEFLFENAVTAILQRARSHGRSVRAFGEMVALMWQKGWQDATVRLEHLWDQLCQRESLPLFCAYPRAGFAEGSQVAIQQICDLHTRVVSGRRNHSPTAA